MFNTLAVLSYILEDVDTGDATRLRDLNDGDKGWTTWRYSATGAT